MTSSAIALSVIFGIVAIGSLIGFLAGFRRRMDLEQWTVGARGFGSVLLWLLMAGEVYTTFAFLGASGWAFSKGGPALYILAYLTLAYVVSFYILPPIWDAGSRHGLQTEPDFFEKRYGNRFLTALVALIGIVSIIPYLQLQLTGLGIIVGVASFDGIGRTPAMTIAGFLVTAFVLSSGVRAVAWVSILKDFLLLFVAAFIGIAVPAIYFGGIGRMFSALVQAKPAHLTMPGSTPNLGHAWFVSTVLLSSLGFYMWPHAFGACYTAKSGDVLRRNAVIMPLYSLTLPFVFFVGFAALLLVPGIGNGDLALLTVVRQTFPAWFLGLIGGAGALTAMVPAAILLLTAATLFAKNIFRPIFAPSMSNDQVAKVAKAVVVLISLVGLACAVFSTTTLVSLLLLGYAGVAQFFPGVVFGLFWKRVTTAGIFAGMVAGLVCLFILFLSNRDPFLGLNAGFVALCANGAVAAGVSLCTPVMPNGLEDEA
jgi:SSS family solute:Na+ symporter